MGWISEKRNIYEFTNTPRDVRAAVVSNQGRRVLRIKAPKTDNFDIKRFRYDAEAPV